MLIDPTRDQLQAFKEKKYIYTYIYVAVLKVVPLGKERVDCCVSWLIQSSDLSLSVWGFP